MFEKKIVSMQASPTPPMAMASVIFPDKYGLYFKPEDPNRSPDDAEENYRVFFPEMPKGSPVYIDDENLRNFCLINHQENGEKCLRSGMRDALNFLVEKMFSQPDRAGFNRKRQKFKRLSRSIGLEASAVRPLETGNQARNRVLQILPLVEHMIHSPKGRESYDTSTRDKSLDDLTRVKIMPTKERTLRQTTRCFIHYTADRAIRDVKTGNSTTNLAQKYLSLWQLRDNLRDLITVLRQLETADDGDTVWKQEDLADIKSTKMLCVRLFQRLFPLYIDVIKGEKFHKLEKCDGREIREALVQTVQNQTGLHMLLGDELPASDTEDFLFPASCSKSSHLFNRYSWNQHIAMSAHRALDAILTIAKKYADEGRRVRALHALDMITPALYMFMHRKDDLKQASKDFVSAFESRFFDVLMDAITPPSQKS